MELFLSRDENAIRESAAKYWSTPVRFGSWDRRGSAQTAEECEHDTYLEAWNRIPPHEPKNYLYAFLARITRHIALNCCRDRARLKRSGFWCELSREMEACIPSPDDMDSRIDDTDAAGDPQRISRRIAGRKTEPFLIRRYWYLDSIADIAERFALSESKVKTTLFRCRRQLREHLEKGGYKI